MRPTDARVSVIESASEQRCGPEGLCGSGGRRVWHDWASLGPRLFGGGCL